MASDRSSTRSPGERSRDPAGSSAAQEVFELLEELRPQLVERWSKTSADAGMNQLFERLLARISAPRSNTAPTPSPSHIAGLSAVSQLRASITDLAEARGRPLVGPLGRELHHAIDELSIECIHQAAEPRGNGLDSDFLERFLALLAHDLRNPISAIKLAASILARDRQDSDGRRRTVQRVTSNTDRLMRTLEDSLDYARLRSKHELRLEVATTDLDALCRAVLGALEAAYPARRLAFESTGPVESTCDKERLGRALANLIAAAVEHAAPDSETLVRLEAGTDIAVTVENASLELSRDELEVLFDFPFQRGPATSGGSRARGFGLGLHVAREVVTAHGGTLRAESAAPGGTTFVLKLSLKTRVTEAANE